MGELRMIGSCIGGFILGSVCMFVLLVTIGTALENKELREKLKEKK
jgi:hypothetical protein